MTIALQEEMVIPFQAGKNSFGCIIFVTLNHKGNARTYYVFAGPFSHYTYGIFLSDSLKLPSLLDIVNVTYAFVRRVFSLRR